MTRETCFTCGEPKDGTHKTYCKACMAKRRREYRVRHPEMTEAHLTWVAACRRLRDGLLKGSLILESRKGELRFRYSRTPATGPFLRRGKHFYAAVVAKKDWPMEVPLFRPGSRVA